MTTQHFVYRWGGGGTSCRDRREQAGTNRRNGGGVPHSVRQKFASPTETGGYPGDTERMQRTGAQVGAVDHGRGQNEGHGYLELFRVSGAPRKSRKMLMRTGNSDRKASSRNREILSMSHCNSKKVSTEAIEKQQKKKNVGGA